MALIKKENSARLYDKGTDFNYTDLGYTQKLQHEIRINKRPITAKPDEKFGSFTQSLFGFDN